MRKTPQELKAYKTAVIKAIQKDLQQDIKETLSYYILDSRLTAKLIKGISNVILKRYTLQWKTDYTREQVTLWDINIPPEELQE